MSDYESATSLYVALSLNEAITRSGVPTVNRFLFSYRRAPLLQNENAILRRGEFDELIEFRN